MQPSVARPSKSKPSCGLYVIPSLDGRSAVVFRRGPSKRVMISRWWLKDDRIEYGHWFAGRLYERYSDLSPDGELLLYFAARYKRRPPTWTGVSRAPYLTALVMWTCFVNGGGFFESNRSVILDDCVSRDQLLSKNRTLLPFPEEELRQYLTTRSAKESDDLRRYYCPEHRRLVRDGWRCVNEGVRMIDGHYGATPRLVEPQIYERQMPNEAHKTGAVVLRRVMFEVGEYKTKEAFEVLGADGSLLRDMEKCTWADWHLSGDLLFARDGCLYRLKQSLVATRTDDLIEGAKLVHDFRSLEFEKLEPPAWANKWPS